jgi:ferritin-like metal-binding protein YciE
MEERRNFMLNMAKQTDNYAVLKTEREHRAGELQVHIESLKQILEELGQTAEKQLSRE